MNKTLTAKRLMKRHNRHALSDKNWADTSASNLGTLERMRATRGTKPRTGKASPKVGT